MGRVIELQCNELDENGLTNLFHAATNNNKYLLDLLTAQPHIRVGVGNNDDLLLHRVHDNVKFAKFLVDKGFDVNKIDGFRRTPLMQILTSNHGVNVDVVRYLIEAGANVNYNSQLGTSPLQLHVACEYFHLESIKILLEAGADFNVKNNNDKTPLECLPIEFRSIVTNIMA